jgi:hypothetical protein
MSIDDATPEEWDTAMRMTKDIMSEHGNQEMFDNVEKAYSSKIDYKFREDKLIEEFKRYIDSTYTGHYSKNKFQSTEVIIERGHGTGFCMGNIDKYSNRYGNKGTRDDARKDLMKVLHYALIQLYIHDTENS